jgi:hypothetical protein
VRRCPPPRRVYQFGFNLAQLSIQGVIAGLMVGPYRRRDTEGKSLVSLGIGGGYERIVRRPQLRLRSLSKGVFTLTSLHHSIEPGIRLRHRSARKPALAMRSSIGAARRAKGTLGHLSGSRQNGEALIFSRTRRSWRKDKGFTVLRHGARLPQGMIYSMRTMVVIMEGTAGTDGMAENAVA